MKARVLFAAAAGAGALATGMAAQAHHDFRAEFDANSPILLHGKVTGVEWVNPHTWLHIAVSEPGRPDQQWMVQATTPNSLLRQGLDRNSLATGTIVTIRGYQAKDRRCLPSAMDHKETCKANGKALILADGRELFISESTDCGPVDRADPDPQAPCPTYVQAPARPQPAYVPIPAGSLDGELIFKARCAGCHDPLVPSQPYRKALAERPTEEITAALTSGSMQPIATAAGLSPAQIQAVARYLVGLPGAGAQPTP